MTLVREYQPTFVLGDGETKEFSYLFEEVSENFIKVIVKHSDDSTYVPVFSVDLDSHKVMFGESETAPLDTDIVCIYRETPDLQDTPFRTLQGYDAKALENILSKIVAMIQELKANGFSTQILQGTPWQLDLLHPADDGASVVVDYNARILKKGLYFQIVSGNLQVSADGNNFIKMPKSADITEFRRLETVLEDLTVQYRLQYKVDGVWYNAESNAEATANEALQVAQDAKDIAQAASDKVDAFDDRLAQAEQDSSDAKQDASDAKDIAQDASDAVSAHITDTNNPHSVTAAQAGALPDTTKYGAALSLTINSTNYVVTAQLKDQDGNNLGTAQTIDLPLESVVVSGSYDSATKEVVLTLQGGSTIRFSVADLVSGLQTEITALNMLSADLVDDTSTTHKFVTTTEKSTWSGKQDAISDLATIRSGAAAGATAVQPGDLATVATSGSYNDLSNKPTIPAAQVNSDWNANTGVAQILNKPTLGTMAAESASDYTKTSGLATVATSGNYNDLNNKPTIPTVNNPTITITQGGVAKGSFTLNQASGDTIALDAGGGGGAVDSVNGKTGVVVLTATDVGALPDSTVIPDAQIQSDWNQADNTKVDYIKNKPSIPTVNNPTITITQGGVTKGSFKLNQATGDTIALDAGGGSSPYIIDKQEPTAENNYTWYRKWSDGWVEQGGKSSNSNTSGVLVTMAITMASTDYTILVAPVNGSGYGTSGYGGDSRTTTTFKVYCNNNGGRPSWWVVYGMAA